MALFLVVVVCPEELAGAAVEVAEEDSEGRMLVGCELRKGTRFLYQMRRPRGLPESRVLEAILAMTRQRLREIETKERRPNGPPREVSS
jgi:hypothetical protein